MSIIVSGAKQRTSRVGTLQLRSFHALLIPRRCGLLLPPRYDLPESVGAHAHALLRKFPNILFAILASHPLAAVDDHSTIVPCHELRGLYSCPHGCRNLQVRSLATTLVGR